ncbi:TetR family transcriptional regulator [Candidatus Binatia bacterium]|nr:TetR family transcriptional regulator [Candidatus Binatia bacterium]
MSNMATPAIRTGELGLPQSEQKRRAILDAALRVVADGGVEAVTHRRVAAEADVPLGSTTYYFASRDDLLREAFRYHAALVYGAVDEIADGMRLASTADVVAFLLALVRREIEDRALIVVEYELIVRAARDPVLAREVNAYERALAARLGEALERLGVVHAFDAARTLIALVRGFELECLTRETPVLDALQARLELVLSALGSARTRTRAGAARAAAQATGSAHAKTARTPGRNVAAGRRKRRLP